MKIAWVFLLGAVIGAAVAFPWTHLHNAQRSRLFVSDSFYDPGIAAIAHGAQLISNPALDHMNDIHQSCPQVAFVSTEGHSDYSLTMFWDKNHWRAILHGNDQPLLYESSPDFDKIIRDACKAIRQDQQWPIRPTRALEKQNVLLDRYELHDLRNGNTSTSALLDKQTGKVWVWSTITNRQGKETGTSAFMSEDVLPSPDNQ